MTGSARDVVTPAVGGAPALIEEQALRATISPLRVVEALETTPPLPGLETLIGVRAGGHLREALDQAVTTPAFIGSPLHMLLDDLSGATLVATWAWSSWTEDWQERIMNDPARQFAGRSGQMEGVCTGFAPGSSALSSTGQPQAGQNTAAVPALVNPDDPTGWHAFAEPAGVTMRRARWIDVWHEKGDLRIESGFQDSATVPEGGRRAIHEYRVSATADPDSGQIRSIVADPRVLPYAECPGAILNVGRLVGTGLDDVRTTVIAELKGIAGCTHLNDVLRMLVAAPRLAAMLGSAA